VLAYVTNTSSDLAGPYTILLSDEITRTTAQEDESPDEIAPIGASTPLRLLKPGGLRDETLVDLTGLEPATEDIRPGRGLREHSESTDSLLKRALRRS
jgi:hypothetical protein